MPASHKIFSSVSLHSLNKLDNTSLALPRIKRKNSLNSSENDYYYPLVDSNNYQSHSDLNCWYRQLGGASQTQAPRVATKPKPKKQQTSIKLPKIAEHMQMSSSNASTPLGWPTNTKLKKKKKANDFGIGYTESFVLEKENVKPPAPTSPAATASIDRTNMFVMKCISDVAESNRPDKMKLSEPRELKYVNELSGLRYISVGFGKSYGCKWSIELFRL
jgi:hypothetical protein